MFDFDVVTGPTPPLCKLPDQDEPAPAAGVEEPSVRPEAAEPRPAQPLRR